MLYITIRDNSFNFLIHPFKGPYWGGELILLPTAVCVFSIKRTASKSRPSKATGHVFGTRSGFSNEVCQPVVGPSGTPHTTCLKIGTRVVVVGDDAVLLFIRGLAGPEGGRTIQP